MFKDLQELATHKSLEEVIDDETVQNTLTKSETIQNKILLVKHGCRVIL